MTGPGGSLSTPGSLEKINNHVPHTKQVVNSTSMNTSGGKVDPNVKKKEHGRPGVSGYTLGISHYHPLPVRVDDVG